MNRTAENLLTWAPLGAAAALMLSDHRRWGLLIGLVSPITVAMEHPRGTRRALKAIPKSLAKAGESVGRGAAQAGKSLKWATS
ncbi:MAG TPA: hypothetical protein VN709_09920 [Terriglobales bacterium]|nr:hypothetical protein [Terriglobales bacterium]